MGSVYKKGKGWAIRYYLPGSTREDRKRKSISGFPDKESAEKELERIEAMKVLGLLKESVSFTINDVLDKWFNEHVIVECSSGTIDFYDSKINKHIKPNIGHLKLDTLKVGMITKFYNKLKSEKITQSTIDKIHRTLRAAFYYNYQQEYITDRFMDRVKTIKYEIPELDDSENYWTPEIINKALPLLKDSPIYFNIYQALYFGLRAEETAAINEADIDFNAGTLKVRHALVKAYGNSPKGVYIKQFDKTTFLQKTKNKKTRTLPLTSEMSDFYRKQIIWTKRNRLRYDCSYNGIFVGYLSVWPDGNIKANKFISQRWNTDMKNIQKIDENIPTITFHGLRHSCASWLYYKGVDIKTIQEILGHSDIKITSKIYTHLDLDQKKEALNRLTSS